MNIMDRIQSLIAKSKEGDYSWDDVMPIVEELEDIIEKGKVEGYKRHIAFFYISQPRIAMQSELSPENNVNILGKGNNRLERLYDVLDKFHKLNLKIL